MPDIHSRACIEDASLLDVLDRIIDKGIVLEPWVRLTLGLTDLRAANQRIVVASERRRKPFILPPEKSRPANRPSQRGRNQRPGRPPAD